MLESGISGVPVLDAGGRPVGMVSDGDLLGRRGEGGGIIPGAIHGASDKIGAYPATDPVTPDDIAATMFWALGIDPATVVYDTLKRPLPIAAGMPITRIFA